MNARSLQSCWVGLAVLWSAAVGSMEKRTESLEQVIRKSRLAVVASATDVSSRREGAVWRVLEFHAQVESSIFGEPTTGALGCTYEEGQTHLRGQTAVSPQVSGSGIEFEIKAGDRVILLVERTPTHGNDCRVLRIEPLSSFELVRGLRR